MTYSSYASDFIGKFLKPTPLPPKKNALHPLRLSSFKEEKKSQSQEGKSK